jgi:hypothetical protein
VAAVDHVPNRRLPPMEKKPFVPPTLREEASLAEVTLTASTGGGEVT